MPVIVCWRRRKPRGLLAALQTFLLLVSLHSTATSAECPPSPVYVKPFMLPGEEKSARALTDELETALYAARIVLVERESLDAVLEEYDTEIAIIEELNDIPPEA